MPTTLPRVQVSFGKSTHQALEDIAKIEGVSLSQLVSNLVDSALELAEDLALVQTAERRLATLRRDDMLSSDYLLKWNKSRKKKA